jgi:hypothetical protein
MRISMPVPGAPLGMDKDAFRASVIQHLAHTRVRDQYRATPIDVMHAVGRATRDRLADRWLECSKRQWDAGKKRVYYLSMEYLPGRLLRDGLANLGMLEEARAALADLGLELDEVLEVEPDPGLGNGGLGRLASCFLDSMATLGIAGTGYGIRYDYGIFRQALVEGVQSEEPDSWLAHGSPFGVHRSETHYRVKYGGRVEPRADASGRVFYAWVDTQDVIAEAHDVPVPGYRNDVVNTLRLWWARPVVAFDLAKFNAGDHTGSVAEAQRRRAHLPGALPERQRAGGQGAAPASGVLLRLARRLQDAITATSRALGHARRLAGPQRLSAQRHAPCDGRGGDDADPARRAPLHLGAGLERSPSGASRTPTTRSCPRPSRPGRSTCSIASCPRQFDIIQRDRPPLLRRGRALYPEATRRR